MRVLVVTAVPVERDAVTRAFGDVGQTVELPGAVVHRRGAFDVVAGGAGPAAAAAATAFALAGVRSAGPYGLVVSAGIGGAFTPLTPLGSLVTASGIVAADLGAESADGFLPVTALGFGRDRFAPPPALVRAVAAATGAATGPVLTVSTVTGSAERAAALLAAHPGALAEAMEGFGVAEAAARAGVPALELRAVSNAVGPRDRDAWRIGDALAALTEAFGALANTADALAAAAEASTAAAGALPGRERPQGPRPQGPGRPEQPLGPGRQERQRGPGRPEQPEGPGRLEQP